MIHIVITAHEKYIGNPFLIRDTARFYSLATELFERIVANQSALGTSFIPKDRIDLKIAKLVTYTYGILLGYKAVQDFSDGWEKYSIQKQFAIPIQLSADSVYFFYDGVLLRKFFTAKPFLFPFQEIIRGTVSSHRMFSRLSISKTA